MMLGIEDVMGLDLEAWRDKAITEEAEVKRYDNWIYKIYDECPYKQTLMITLRPYAKQQGWTWTQFLRAWITGGLDCPDGKVFVVNFYRMECEPCTRCTQVSKICEHFSP